LCTESQCLPSCPHYIHLNRSSYCCDIFPHGSHEDYSKEALKICLFSEFILSQFRSFNSSSIHKLSPHKYVSIEMRSNGIWYLSIDRGLLTLKKESFDNLRTNSHYTKSIWLRIADWTWVQLLTIDLRVVHYCSKFGFA
jgi:hypothetical protein